MGCSTVVAGKPVSVFADPFKVAGMRAVDGPTGLRPGAQEKSRDVTDGDGGKIDQIAGASVSDIEEYWEGAYSEVFPGSFKPVSQLVSWDADDYEGTFCEEDTYGLVNAAFCPLDSTIGWDRGVLLPALRRANGDMAITMVLAHEYGHSVQKQARLNKRGTSVLVAEQQADCLAGTYMRWVAEGNSPRFTLSTGDGLNNLLAGMISFRDPLLSVEDVYSGGAGDEHGSAFERISAFQFGFIDGPSACAAIDDKEVAQRRGDLPVALQRDESGELAGVRRIGEGHHRRDEHPVPARPAADADVRRRVGRRLPRRAAEPAGVVLPVHQHHRRRSAGDGEVGHPAGRRGQRRCFPVTTPPTRC